MKNNFKLILLVLLLSTNLFSNNEIQKVSLQLKWKYQFQFAGFIAAKEKGFYKDMGLDVKLLEYTKATDTIQDMQDGKTEFGVSDSALILEALKGVPVIAMMAVYQESPYILMGLKSSNINTLEDLNGKKLAINDYVNEPVIKSMLKIHNVKFIKQSITDKLNRLKNKEIDMIIAYISNEPYTAKKMGIDITIINPSDYGFERYGDILFTSKDTLEKKPELVKKMYKASKKGFEYAFSHIDEMVEIIYNKYNTQNKSKEALLYEANILKKMSGIGKNFGELNKIKLEHIAYIYSYSKLLKYNPQIIDDFIYKPANTKIINFTKKEKEYLKQKKQITMCVDPDWMPFEKIENSKHIGIASDYIKLISKKIQTDISLVKTTSWSQSLQKAKDRECDILSMAQETPKRTLYMDFTSPYAEVPTAIATKTGISFIDNLEKVKTRKLGIVKGYSLISLYKDKFPGINIVEVDSVKDGLNKVESGEIFGYIDNSIVLNEEIQKNYLGQLNISGKFNVNFKLSVATRNDKKILHNIFEKAILSIDKHTKQTILDKWIRTNYISKTDYTVVWKILIISAIIIIFFIYWNRRLNKEVKDRKSTEIKLKDSEERFRTLFDISPIMIDSFDENGRCTLWNKECEKVFGWTQDEINTHENNIALFYPDPKIQQEVINSFTDTKNKNVFIEWHPITKSGKEIVTLWANVNLTNNETINIGLNITAQREAEIEAKNKTIEIENAKNELDLLNSELKMLVAKEVKKSRQKDVILQQQSKMASMGEMVENIAHQWRQPLAQINSAVMLAYAIMHKNSFKNDKVEEKLTEIESLTEYMSKTINDFQNFFNPNKKKENFSLRQAIEKSLFIVKGSLASSYIEVVTDIDKVFMIDGYENELQQVIVVILNNARDALKSRDIANPKININTKKMDDYYIIEICDNAGGVDSSIIEKIFEPYFTTKHQSRGTGLGLYMSKMIIEDGLKGKLLVENKGKGSCFKILLKE